MAAGICRLAVIVFFILPLSASAAIVSVTGALVVDFPDGDVPGITLTQPFATTSIFETDKHDLAPVVLGVESRADGMISSGLFQLPYLAKLELASTVMQGGSIARSGSTAGLALGLGDLSLSGEDVYAYGILDQTDRETVHFSSVELGGIASAQPGTIEGTHAPIGMADFESAPWSVSANTLNAFGLGLIELEAPITITTNVQSGDPVEGVARLSLNFVPEPSFSGALVAGFAMLGFLRRRSR